MLVIDANCTDPQGRHARALHIYVFILHWPIHGSLIFSSCRRKERCTGLQPCIACLSAGFECQYNASYRRGRLPKIQTIEDPSSSLDNDRSRSVNLPPPATQEESGTPLDPTLDAYRDAQEAIEEDEISIIPQIRVGTQALIQCSGEHNAQPRATGADLEPHYIGPSSGLSFLLRAQMRLRNTVKSSKATSIFTFGDAPFPEVDCAFLELPPLEEARSLLAVYFDFAFPTHRFLHRPSVEQWLSDFYLHRNRLDLAPGTRERYATVLMVLSQSKLYTPSKLTGDLDIEGRYAPISCCFTAIFVDNNRASVLHFMLLQKINYARRLVRSG